MRTIDQIKNIPFFMLTIEEKKALIAAKTAEAETAEAETATDARTATIAAMVADTMKKAR